MSSIVSVIGFLFALFFAFFIPGNTLLNSTTLPRPLKVGLSIALGLVLWGYQAFILGFANLRVGTYFYLAIFFIIWLYQHSHAFREIRKGFKLSKISIDPVLFLIFSVGIVFMVSAVWFIGSPSNGGLFFCCRGVPDDIYHLSLTSQLVKSVPPFEPGASGIIVKNYHYWSNLIMADTIRVFGTDLMSTVYKFFPVLLSILLAISVYSLSAILNLGRTFSRWLAFFVFFGGDILFILTWIFGRGINFNVYGLDDVTKLLAGPPRSFSIVIIFWTICLFAVWIKRRNLVLDIVLALMFGSLTGMKIYTGIFAIIGLGTLGGYYLLRRDFRRLVMPIASAIFSILIFLPVNGGGNGIGIYLPWAFREFIAKADLGTTFLVLRRDIYARDGKTFQVISYDLLFAAIYIIFIFGTLNLAFLQTVKSLSKIPRELNIFMISGIAVTLFLGFFGSQTIGGGNTIQFVIALIFFGAIYAALAISNLLERIPKKAALVISSTIVLLTASRAIHEGLQNFVMARERMGFTVSADEISALNFLKTENCNQCTIAIFPDWSDQETYMHVSFLTGKPVFLAGYIGVLADHKVAGIIRRREINQEIFRSANKETVFEDLSKNGIKYLFMPKSENLPVGNLDGTISEAYSSETTKVLYFDEQLITHLKR